jgi:hypothetical protein
LLMETHYHEETFWLVLSGAITPVFSPANRARCKAFAAFEKYIYSI